MRDWPPIVEPELVSRLRLDDGEFRELIFDYSSNWGHREYTPERLEFALGYPWERPSGSYLLRGDRVEVLAEMDPASREALQDNFTKGRHPVLAFGGNGSPSWLEQKFAHFTEEDNRSVLVLTGHLHDHDVGFSASPSPFGNIPATLFASPGTAVRAAMVWCTTDQITQLTWTEVPYRLGRLDEAVFETDDSDVEVEGIFAYVSRFGAFCADGRPVALAAIPARNRTARAFTEEGILDFVAPRLIGPDARAEDVVRAIWHDAVAVFTKAAETMWPDARQLQSEWTPFPD